MLTAEASILCTTHTGQDQFTEFVTKGKVPGNFPNLSPDTCTPISDIAHKQAAEGSSTNKQECKLVSIVRR
jgi:hypothetical protein